MFEIRYSLYDQGLIFIDQQLLDEQKGDYPLRVRN